MCDLCDKEKRESNWFYLVICSTCKVPMIVSIEHKENFNQEEIDDIERMFPDKKIQWKQRAIKDHAHCHLR